MPSAGSPSLAGKRALSSPLLLKFPPILDEPQPASPSVGANGNHVVEASIKLGFLSIEHGLLAMDRQMSVVSRIINMSEGRDKIFKLLSSFCKAFRWLALRQLGQWMPAWYLAEGWGPFLAERLSNLQRSTSLTRKFLKLGLAESFTRLLIKVWLREQMGWRKLLAMGRLAGMAVYGFWNYPVWACKVGLVKMSHKRYTVLGLKGYLLSTACQMVLDIVLLVQNYQLAGRLSQYEREMGLDADPVIQERLAALAEKRSKHWISIFKNTIDSLSAVNGIRHIGLNDLHVGVLGMISSSIGCALLYNRILHEKEIEKLRNRAPSGAARKAPVAAGVRPAEQRAPLPPGGSAARPGAASSLAGHRAASLRNFGLLGGGGGSSSGKPPARPTPGQPPQSPRRL